MDKEVSVQFIPFKVKTKDLSISDDNSKEATISVSGGTYSYGKS
jgi:hypothetical protein